MRELASKREQLVEMRHAASVSAAARFDGRRVVTEVADVLRRAASSATPA
jgi:hypothetical protein